VKRAHLKCLVGSLLLLTIVVPSIVSVWFTPYSPNATSLGARLEPPFTVGDTGVHVLGTDQLGRDILSRLMIGGQVSLVVAVLAVLMSGVIGTIIGLAAGYFGSWFDAVATMLGEIQLSLPTILIIVIFLAVIGPNIVTVAIVLGIADWVIYSRMARGRAFVEKVKDYVVAARTLGATGPRIVLSHLLPNVLPTIIVVAAVQVGSMILLESSLSFLGLGATRPTASWGRMVGDGQPYLRDAWWVAMMPGMAIGLVVLGINVLCDGIRELWKME
jgi:peptide/nickel transport system permease protein